MTDPDSEPMALAFIEAFNRHQIPYQQYGELYTRAMDLRARRLAQGLKTDDFSADLLIACWPGLKSELHDREVAAGRTLTATSATQCLRCYGTGMENVFDDEGRSLGVRPGCKHEHVDTSDPSMNGFDQAFDALATPHRPETALEICARLRKQLAYEYATAIGDAESERAWAGSKALNGIERYIRQVDN